MNVSGSESPTGLPRLQPMRESIMINKSAALSFLETSKVKHILKSVLKALHCKGYIILLEESFLLTKVYFWQSDKMFHGLSNPQ